MHGACWPDSGVAQVVEAEELEGQLYAELDGLPKYGRQFAAAVRTILKRENRCARLCPQSALQELPGCRAALL